MSASNNGLTSDAAGLTPRARLLAGMSLQWEEHKRKAQDAQQPPRAPHGDATHVGKPQWRGGK